MLPTKETIVFLGQAGSFCMALFGFLYGVLKVWALKRPMYMKIVVMAIGGAVLARCFNLGVLMTEGTLRKGFSVSGLGTLCTFFGLLSANFGQIDRLVDDGSARFRSGRRAGRAAAAAVLLTVFAVLPAPVPAADKISDCLAVAVIAAAVFFHAKHLAVPDVEGGIAFCLRRYNMLSLLLSLFSIGEILAADYGLTLLFSLCFFADGMLINMIIFSLDRGVERWME